MQARLFLGVDARRPLTWTAILIALFVQYVIPVTAINQKAL
jgi:hypothetical protein